jgi:hypothetical protein
LLSGMLSQKASPVFVGQSCFKPATCLSTHNTNKSSNIQASEMRPLICTCPIQLIHRLETKMDAPSDDQSQHCRQSQCVSSTPSRVKHDSSTKHRQIEWASMTEDNSCKNINMHTHIQHYIFTHINRETERERETEIFVVPETTTYSKHKSIDLTDCAALAHFLIRFGTPGCPS